MVVYERHGVLSIQGLRAYLESFDPDDDVACTNPGSSEGNVISVYVEHLYPELFVGRRRARTFSHGSTQNPTPIYVYSPEEGDSYLLKVDSWAGLYLRWIEDMEVRDLSASEALEVLGALERQLNLLQ